MEKIKIMYLGLALAIGLGSLQSCIKRYDNPAHGDPGWQITVFALKQQYKGSAVALTPEQLGNARKINGIVISDRGALNIAAGSFVLQETFTGANSVSDVTRGIVVKTTGAATTVNMGDSIVVYLEGSKLDRINGQLTITDVKETNVQIIASGKTPLVRYVTQGMLHVAMDEYESTLVSLNADATEAGAGVTLAGSKKLNDNTGPEVLLRTLAGASFAGTTLPVNAQFNGIAGYYNESSKDTAGAKKIISPRNAADIQFVSGALYPGFPESFETPDASVKASYNSGTNIAALGTGNWYLLQAILGNTIVSDKFNQPGKQGIRMQQNLTTSGYVQMNFDVPNGASKVSLFYGKYATDAKSSFRLEYSVNGGTTWVTVGTNITDMPEKGNKQVTYALNLTGPVRFRVNKLGIGTSNNGRLCIDDFAIYRN